MLCDLNLAVPTVQMVNKKVELVRVAVHRSLRIVESINKLGSGLVQRLHMLLVFIFILFITPAVLQRSHIWSHYITILKKMCQVNFSQGKKGWKLVKNKFLNKILAKIYSATCIW